MPNIDFVWPYAGLLLPLILLLLLFKNSEEQVFLSSPIVYVIKKINNYRSKFSLKSSVNWVLVLLLFLLSIALMRPRLLGDAIEISRDGRNILMVLDISESMEALDMKLNGVKTPRINVAKHAMNKFIDQREGDRIGLVVFGSETFLHAPLSFDHKTIKRFLNDAMIGFAGPKTAIGDAIGLSIKTLLDQKDDSRIIVLLTDGENNEGSLTPMKAANIAKEQDIKLYIVGLGASQMVVDGFFGPTQVNPSQSLERAEPELKEMATMTGGIYFRAKDESSLKKVYEQIDKLEPNIADPLVLTPKKELFYWPLLFAILVMLFNCLRVVIVR